MANPFKPLLKRIPPPFRNRYYLVLGIFFLWLLLFDRHDFLTQWKLQRTYKGLQKEKKDYQQKIMDVKQDWKDIQDDKEKFAREHYYMKRADEDVFVVEKK